MDFRQSFYNSKRFTSSSGVAKIKNSQQGKSHVALLWLSGGISPPVDRKTFGLTDLGPPPAKRTVVQTYEGNSGVVLLERLLS